MTSMGYLREQEDSCTITIEASPGADQTEIVGVNPWRNALQVRIAARAKDGEANAELLRFLSWKLAVPVSSIRIIKGERSSTKVIRVPLPALKVRYLLRGD